MAKPRILLMLDTDPQPSVFDAVVAVDAGAEHLLRYGGIVPKDVRDLVHGAMFTRGGSDLANTAIFVGGSDVTAGEAVLAAIEETFFGPVRNSVMLDCNGCNTTAAAAVAVAQKHLPLAGSTAAVLGATGPVGSRIARLLAQEGAKVRVGSRDRSRAGEICNDVRASVANAHLEPWGIGSDDILVDMFDGAELLFSAGAAGVELVSSEVSDRSPSLKVFVDLNAVPPMGIAGIEATDNGQERNNRLCFGALGVGGTKMKIHKAALERLFQANDLVLDVEQIFEIAREIEF